MSIKRLYRKAAFRFLKLLSISISAVLGIFCSSGCIMNEATPAYGAQTADYKVSGTVVSSDHNLPIKGLSVSIRDTMNYYGTLDSVETDSLGRFSLTRYPGTYDLNIKDIDSTENGSFVSKDTLFSITDAEKVVDIKLDKKE